MTYNPIVLATKGFYPPYATEPVPINHQHHPMTAPVTPPIKKTALLIPTMIPSSPTLLLKEKGARIHVPYSSGKGLG
jgi:hypothetical protein